MATQALPYVTLEQYLEQEERAETPSEYWQGEVFPMIVGGPRHALIIANLFGFVRPAAREKKYLPYGGARLRVSETGLYTYPDITVVCGPAQYTDDRKGTLTNPKLIFEVLSDSTEDYDRGRKFQRYRSLPSLTEYVAVAQRSAHVEHYLRQSDNRWLITEVEGLHQTIRIETLDCDLPLSAIYEDVEFD